MQVEDNHLCLAILQSDRWISRLYRLTIGLILLFQNRVRKIWYFESADLLLSDYSKSNNIAYRFRYYNTKDTHYFESNDIYCTTEYLVHVFSFAVRQFVESCQYKSIFPMIYSSRTFLQEIIVYEELPPSLYILTTSRKRLAFRRGCSWVVQP
jgi:hypothetical protein